MFDIEIVKLAALEPAEAFAWCEQQDRGLGDELLRDTEQVKKRLEVNLTFFPLVRGEIRRALMNRFPYAV